MKCSNKPEVVIQLCNIIANLSQNNEVFAKDPLCFDVLKVALLRLKSTTLVSPEVRPKLLYVANSIVAGNNEVAQKIAIDAEVGLKFLLGLMITTRDLMFTERLSRFIGKLLLVSCKLIIIN